MKTYTLEIDGDPIAAFRALDDVHAKAIVDGAGNSDDLLMEVIALERHDGSPLWNGKSIPAFRPATTLEHQVWLWRASRFEIETSRLDVAYLHPVRIFISLEDDAEAA